MAKRGTELYAVGLRTLACQWCVRDTIHDTHKAWLHCSTCQRCYTCGAEAPCVRCQRYQRSTLAQDQPRELPLDWLDSAMRWMREGET